MKNLSGSARYRRLKMAGRQFGWYRGCSRPFEDGGRFFIIRILTDVPVKLGGTARKEKLVPWDVFSFCVF